MLIQCTRKLLDQLKIKPSEVPRKTQPLFSWHANILTINRRKTVVLVNDSNRYVVVLYGLLAKDFQKLDQLIFEAIITTFREEGIREDIISQFINESPTITYSKTKDRTSVARMNKSIDPVQLFAEDMDHKVKIQAPLSFRVSRFLVGDGTGDYIYPNSELYRDLEEFAGKSVIQTKAVQIKVTLNLEDFQVWRRLVIPLHMTFRQLHQALQYTFSWKNYHLHEFYIYDNKIKGMKDDEWNINHPAYNREGKKPILNVVSDEEAFSYGDDDIPMKLDAEIKLSEYLPEHQTIKYIYDFGDDWRHDIEVETFIDDYDKNYPVCVEGEGDTPPEDVGGERGYKEFLKIIGDESHPNHGHMIAWSDQQRFRNFDIETVNSDLKNLLFS